MVQLSNAVISNMLAVWHCKIDLWTKILNYVCARPVSLVDHRIRFINHNIRISAKIKVYKEVILSSLLYGSMTWTLYECHIKKTRAIPSLCSQINHESQFARQSDKCWNLTMCKSYINWSNAIKGPTLFGCTCFSNEWSLPIQRNLLWGTERWQAKAWLLKEEEQRCLEGKSVLGKSQNCRLQDHSVCQIRKEIEDSGDIDKFCGRLHKTYAWCTWMKEPCCK